MKLMTIVVPDNNHDYSIDQIYSNELINVVNESDHKGSSLPTLIYTYELAKRLYPDTKFSNMEAGVLRLSIYRPDHIFQPLSLIYRQIDNTFDVKR